MSTFIHPNSTVDPKAQLGDGVHIGPYSVVGPNVKLGNNVRLISQVSLTGDTTIGDDCQLYPFVTMGHPPQDHKHKGGDVRIVIGARNILREHVNIHPGTDAGRRETIMGDDCYMMFGSHLAHDSIMGNKVIISNNVQIGGYVSIGDHAILGLSAAIHQYTRIGAHAFVGGQAWVTGDVIPYGTVVGNPAHLAGLNIVGLRRRGFDKEAIRDLRSAYRLMFAAEGTTDERLEDTARLYSENAQAMEIVEFIKAQDKRSICVPAKGGEL